MADAERLFFALNPNPATARALAQLAARAHTQCHGQVVPLANIHLTLAFLGNVPTDRMSDLHTLAGQITPPAFSMTIDTLGYWRKSGIVWAGCTAPVPPLDMLVAELNTRLRAAGFAVDDRPFAAHVTLLRRARCAFQGVLDPDLPCVWPVTGFSLMRSVQGEGGVRYEAV